MLQLWLIFILLAVIIYFAGSRLTLYADVLGEKWGVHRSFIGLILLSTVTSLPELGTSLSSVIWVEAPNLAVGNILGSNLFNIAIIPLLAILYRKTFLYRANPHHNTTASLITFLYSLAGLGMLLNLGIFPDWLQTNLILSPVSIAIFIFYLGGMYMIFAEKKLPAAADEQSKLLYRENSHGQTIFLFIFFALLVIVSGAALARVGKSLSDLTGLGETFFGTLFFAAVTSLPEIVVSWAAIKQINAVNLALGNIFGSCLFNLAIFPMIDIANISGDVFAELHFSHLVSIFAGLMMVSLASYAIHIRRSRPAKQFFSLEMILLSIIYLGTLLTIFTLR